MSASPITVCVTKTGTHLADTGSSSAWCGANVAGAPTFAFDQVARENFGDVKDDCGKCCRELKNSEGLP